MNITAYPFSNDDTEFELIKKLLLEIETYPTIDNNWDPARMDYWRYNYHSQKEIGFFQEHARYWQTESGQVVALVISEYGRNDFFIVIHPNHWDIFSDLLNWAVTVWGKDKAKISTDIYTYGSQKIEHLLAAGFYEDGHVENVRTYSLREFDFTYDLKSGFKLMSFSEYGNYESRVKLVQNAFNNLNYSEARLRSTQRSPTYRPELDLVIVDSSHESVAYCTGWVEEFNPKSGYIEPMGTHSDYRKQGFGKILAKECFKRLSKLGVENVWIASNAEPDISNFLYDSLNPTGVKRSYRYSLNLEN